MASEATGTTKTKTRYVSHPAYSNEALSKMPIRPVTRSPASAARKSWPKNDRCGVVRSSSAPPIMVMITATPANQGQSGSDDRWPSSSNFCTPAAS